MGRNAKIRQQRKHSPLSAISSLSQKHQPKQQIENVSFFGKVFASLNPFPKLDQEQACLHAHDFCEADQVLVGAIAWSGYQQQGKGLVLVQDKEESPPQIHYIPRQLLKKTMCQHGVEPEDTQAIDNMIEVYEPLNSIVMVYVNHNGDMSASMTPPTKPTPDECYRMMQETK